MINHLTLSAVWFLFIYKLNYCLLKNDVRAEEAISEYKGHRRWAKDVTDIDPVGCQPLKVVLLHCTMTRHRHEGCLPSIVRWLVIDRKLVCLHCTITRHWQEACLPPLYDNSSLTGSLSASIVRWLVIDTKVVCLHCTMTRHWHAGWRDSLRPYVKCLSCVESLWRQRGPGKGKPAWTCVASWPSDSLRTSRTPASLWASVT